MTDDLDEVMEQYPAVDPARRAKAAAAFERATHGQQHAEYWRRVEAMVRAIAGGATSPGSGLVLPEGEVVDGARRLVDEVDRQRAEEEQP